MVALSGGYGLRDFTEALKSIITSHHTQEERLQKAFEPLKNLLANPNFLDERFKKETPERYARYLLHKDPEANFVVLAMVWLPGQGTPLHDHNHLWGIFGIYEGELELTNYRMIEEPKEGTVKLSLRGFIPARKGVIDFIRPPVEEFHMVKNESKKKAITIDVFSQELKRCHIYTPTSKAYVHTIEEVSLSYTPL